MPPLPTLTIRKNLVKQPTPKKDTQEINPLATPADDLDADDSLSNQLVNFLNPDIEIKSEPYSDLDADYMD